MVLLLWVLEIGHESITFCPRAGPLGVVTRLRSAQRQVHRGSATILCVALGLPKVRSFGEVGMGAKVTYAKDPTKMRK